jgi:thiosulfate/3-mercaptopyruvate sulfurtransferase
MQLHPLCTVDELIAILGDPKLRILDATLDQGSGVSPQAIFAESHIPGAVFFDLNLARDVASEYPNMLPSAAAFGEYASTLGIQNDSRIVVYDQQGIFSAPRAWWMFRYFGHDAVQVLNGGLPAWQAVCARLESGQGAAKAKGNFTAKPRADLLRDFAAMRNISEQQTTPILDCRSAARFTGQAAEPRAELRSGHIPHSLNWPYAGLLTAQNTLRPADELTAQLSKLNIDPLGKIVTTCGSGITACIGALALASLGNEQVAVYDGSWSEWAKKCPSANCS